MANPLSKQLEKRKEKEQLEYDNELKKEFSQNQKQEFECPNCDKKFDNEHGLTIHLKQWCKKTVKTDKNKPKIVKKYRLYYIELDLRVDKEISKEKLSDILKNLFISKEEIKSAVFYIRKGDKN